MQCSVFRHKRKVNGRVQISRLYCGRFKLNGELKVTTIPLHTTDKQLAQQKLLLAVTRLETASLIEKLPDYLDGKANDTQLDTQATGASSLSLTQAVTANGSCESAERVATIEESRGLTPAVAACHTEPLNSLSGFESPSLRQFSSSPARFPINRGARRCSLNPGLNPSGQAGASEIKSNSWKK